MLWMQTISRKGCEEQNPQRPYARHLESEEMVPSAWRHAGVILEEENHSLNLKLSKILSEIPCRVSRKASPYWLITVEPSMKEK